jgi:hypothetical protein
MTIVSARPDNLATYRSTLEPVDRNLRSVANNLLQALQTYHTSCPKFSADHTELAHKLDKHASSMDELNGWVAQIAEAFRQADRFIGPVPGFVGPNPRFVGPVPVVVFTTDESVLKHEAEHEAERTVAAARANNADGVGEATWYLNQLNHKHQSGQSLTEAEKAYLQAYYDTIAGHLPEIKKWADGANCLTDEKAPDRNQRATQLASRIADGLLTLSNEVPYDRLPRPVRDIINGDIGVVNPEYNNQGGRLPAFAYPLEDANLRRYAEFMDFMDDYASENAKPSDELADYLRDAAIRWKQQINVMAHNFDEHVKSANHYYAGPGDHNDTKPPSPEEWAKLFPDELSSDALGLVSRNARRSNHWILDDAVRRTLMGMNWQHGSGAAQVILAGTLPNNQLDDTVSGRDAARGALAVVRDASTDYLQFANTANRQVKGAIGGMASAYMDSFARDPRRKPEKQGVLQFPLPNGQQTWGMDLAEGTRANFLKFLAASDPTVYGNFRAKADSRATWYITQTLHAGHTNPADPEYQQALAAAMRLHGSLDGAEIGVLRDIPSDEAHKNQRELMAQNQARARAIADYQTAKGITDGLKFVADVAEHAPGHYGKAASAGKIVLDQLTNAFLKEPEDPDWSKHIQKLQNDIMSLAESQEISDKAAADMKKYMAHIVWLGHQRAGIPAIYRVNRRKVVKAVPDPDGDLPESYRDSVYDSVPGSVQDKGIDAMHAVSGNGSGYGQEWATGSPPQVGSLNEAGGNWSNEDDRYRIFYGNEHRIDYKPAVMTWRKVQWTAEMPDDKPETQTKPVDPNRLPPAKEVQSEDLHQTH